jgi:hypothetical protein
MVDDMNMERPMTIRAVAVSAVIFQLITTPVLAQSPPTKDNAHTYQGGPKTEVPHTMKKAKKTSPTKEQVGPSGGHHYQGGPKTEVPHHMQDKK